MLRLYDEILRAEYSEYEKKKTISLSEVKEEDFSQTSKVTK